MRVDTRAPEVKKVQDGVLEFLLINHPLDCPVCDKGGECPLQDQTLRFGPGESRFVEEKRHFEKPIAISGLVLLDRERCILCDRCTRFSKEVAGDPLIHFVDRGNATQVNTFPDHPFASYFSGNVVQLCPVGALTAVTYRFAARPWDIERVESTCTSCSVGCRVAVESTTNHITRYQGLDSEPVNQRWLCDRGRFDFGWIDSEDRLTTPLLREGGELVEATWGEALDDRRPSAVGRRRHARPRGGRRDRRCPAHQRGLLRLGQAGQVGPAHRQRRRPAGRRAAARGRARPPGRDHRGGLCGVGCRAARTRPQGGAARPLPAAARPRSERGVPVVELTPSPTSLSPLVATSLVHRPGEAAALAAALVAPGDPTGEIAGVPPAAVAAARAALAGHDDRVVVVLGRPSLAESPDGTVAAAGALRSGLPGATFLPVLRRGNVRGALDLGLAPGLLPGRVTLDAGREWFAHHWGSVPEDRGLDTAAMLAAASEGRLHALVLLGADPLADFPDRQLARRALTSVGQLIAVDTFITESTRHATVVLPAAGYAEKEGTTTNLEGRVSRLGRKVVASGTSRADWIIAVELADRMGADLGFERPEDVWDEIERIAPAHAGATRALLEAPGRVDGVLVPATGDPAAGAATLAEVVARDPSAAAAPASVPDGSQGGVGVRVRGVLAPVAPASADGGDAPASDAPPEDAPASDAPPDTPARPPVLTWAAPASVQEPPPRDAYSLRLVSGRDLYDPLVVSVSRTPHLAGLARPAALGVNPFELERLGVDDGGTVLLTSARGAVAVTAVADPAVPARDGEARVQPRQPGSGGADRRGRRRHRRQAGAAVTARLGSARI